VVGEPDNAPSEPAPSWSSPTPRAWVAPEAPLGDDLAPRPMPAPSPTTTAGTARSAEPVHGRPQVPVRLQPLTVADVLDGAWSVITCRPMPVFGATALVLVPAAIVGSILIRAFGTSLDIFTRLRVFFPYVHPGSRASPGWTGAAAAVAVLSLATFVLGVTLARMVSGWYDGRELSAVRAVGEALRRSPAIIAAYLLVLVPKAVGIAAFLVPAWLVFPFLLVVAPVIAFEDAGPIRAIRRSASLVGKRYLRVLFIWSVWLVAEQLVAVAMSLLVDLIAGFTSDEVDNILRPAGWAIIAFVTAPAVAGMAIALYLDLRVRSEGLDLEREAAEAFARA